MSLNDFNLHEWKKEELEALVARESKRVDREEGYEAGFGKGITKVYKAYYKNNKNTEIRCINGKTHDVLHDINSELVEELISTKLFK